ncbi:hypothetical protein EG829_00380 [bacterium]|nr:hypothetical protein [bacterium]
MKMVGISPILILFFVEFPAGPLAIGDEPVREIAHHEFPTGTLRLLSPTDCVKDRLPHYYPWKDRQCLDQAVIMITSGDSDYKATRRVLSFFP